MYILCMQGETLIPWSKRKGGFTACTFVFGKNIYHLKNLIHSCIYVLLYLCINIKI